MAANKIDKKAMERNSIVAFYAERSIFITGGTGFLGKVLIEKLLRSCPGVREIFLLIRPKNGMSIDDRLKKMLELPLFDKLREEQPSSFEKLIPVQGDTAVEGLGLGTMERQVIIDRVSVIFHVAANVRFDENLQKDIFSNTRSTRDVCIMAGSMKKLVALMHVSSAYAHADKPVVDEIVYPPLINWKSAIKMVETLDEETIRTISPKYLGSMPNTYTLSKRLAEEVINDYSKDLPTVIFRPSIVISSIQEPVEGWIDNFNGPVGMLIGGGKGVLRVACTNPVSASDFLPVDVAIKAMLTAAWKRGIETVTKDPEVHVYNSTSYQIRRILNRELVAMGHRINRNTPLEGIIWYPRTYITTSTFIHYILTWIVHLIPAIFIDALLKLSGRKPMLISIQRKVYNTVVQLRHFLHNEWTFRNPKMLQILTKDVPPAERPIFGYDYENFDVERYFQSCLIGAKKYLLHEDMSRMDDVKRHYKRMEWLDRIYNVVIMGVLAWILARAGFFAHIYRQFQILRSY
ncbi:putative fatty acyl-CoA reductase CG5065 [Hylaeus volcanicus]|uniref:putative fatty acyl-CoA reductase CG5065 n=1 Tax=Hylaeus volcanicus TaxID=313075 RepID=UPI0023B7A480|nr:putative fatty acyl-CoA reductase CG5065 [Hylaeus volcanicus]